MKWKIFLTAFASTLAIFFPQNMIGCGPDVDPYDYYTSFFYQHIASTNAFRPFYYTGYAFLYDENDPVVASDLLANEWSTYAGNSVTTKDAKEFVTEFAWKDLNNLYYHIEKSQPLKVPDTVKRNSMTNYFLKQKDMEALGYIMFAKKAEPYVLGDYNNWDAIHRDSLAMSKLIKNGQQLYNAAKKDVFRLKYAYQMIRLAHYSEQYDEAIKLYDAYVPQNTTNSVLQPMCLALKAGALFRNGESKQAAYLFSKAFAMSDVKRISNYLGFYWAIKSGEPRESYLSMCKTNEERTSMLALFALGSQKDETNTMREIYKLQPSSKILEVIATREINKLEEVYFTPMLNKRKGGKEFYYMWSGATSDSSMLANEKRVKELSALCRSIAKDGKSSNDGLFQTAAAYLSLMMRDYVTAKNDLGTTKEMLRTPKVQDQWALTNMLVTINEKDKIDADFEAQILSSIQWLQKKALAEKKENVSYYSITPWKSFYRNLMNEILAKRYHMQGELYKEALAIGAASDIYGNDNNYLPMQFLRNNMSASQVEKLYALLNAKNNSAYDRFIIQHNSLKLADVIDFAGTAYLREEQYAKAIEWFNRPSNATKKYTVDTDPFIELLYDREERFSYETKKTTKLAFAQEMMRLQQLSKTDKANASKYLYKMALGLYNTTYYGHAWQLVQYDRSGSDGYFIPEEATEFQKEYYGCFSAADHFKRAMENSRDANFKAKCLFMMAKCDQKTVRQPQYSDFSYDRWNDYEVAYKDYFQKFKYNRYFSELLKTYSHTAFYDEALSSCSYLSDFINKK